MLYLDPCALPFEWEFPPGGPAGAAHLARPQGLCLRHGSTRPAAIGIERQSLVDGQITEPARGRTGSLPPLGASPDGLLRHPGQLQQPAQPPSEAALPLNPLAAPFSPAQAPAAARPAPGGATPPGRPAEQLCLPRSSLLPLALQQPVRAGASCGWPADGLPCQAQEGRRLSSRKRSGSTWQMTSERCWQSWGCRQQPPTAPQQRHQHSRSRCLHPRKQTARSPAGNSTVLQTVRAQGTVQAAWQSQGSLRGSSQPGGQAPRRQLGHSAGRRGRALRGAPPRPDRRHRWLCTPRPKRCACAAACGADSRRCVLEPCSTRGTCLACQAPAPLPSVSLRPPQAWCMQGPHTVSSVLEPVEIKNTCPYAMQTRRTPQGAIVGSYTIFDRGPRDQVRGPVSSRACLPHLWPSCVHRKAGSHGCGCRCQSSGWRRCRWRC